MILSLLSPDTVRAIVERAVSQTSRLGASCPEVTRASVVFDEACYLATGPLLAALVDATGGEVRSTPAIVERAARGPVRGVLGYDPFAGRA